MSDDLERRLANALHGATLPEAPGTLRDTLLTIPDAAPLGGAMPSRRRLPLALAAALVLAVAGLAGFAVVSRVPAGPFGTSPSASAGEPSAPPAAVSVLDATQLAAAIAAQRAGGVEPQVVVTSVGIDGTQTPGPSTRECGQPTGSCSVIGVLVGFQDPDGTVTVRTPDPASGDTTPPTTAADLAGPVALRLAGTAPIEYLGHVDLQGATGQVDVPTLLAATATAPAGRLRAVDGWLVGIETPSCGPMIDPPLPAPFSCPSNRSVLSAAPVLPVVPMGSNGFSASVPDGAVAVQAGAYGSFAPAPAQSGINSVPRRGLYLVRMVTVDRTECQACRGWLIVGRLDVAPSPAPTASAAATLEVISAAQAAARLAAGRTSLLGQPMIIDGKVALDASRSCAVTDAWCVLGHLDGTTEPVFATGYTNALLLPDTDFPIDGVMAFVVRETGLEYLGYMGYADDGSFVFPFTRMTDLSQQPRGPMVVAARGWLVAGLPLPCPAPMPGTPSNTPFETCPPAWLTQDEVQPGVRTSNSVSYNEPVVGVHVQYGAYGDFAPSPGTTSDGLIAPRFGAYLVRLVFDTRQPEATAPRRWQVVGRLDPAPIVGPPEAAPLPSLPPEATPTPAPSAAISCNPDMGPVASGLEGDPCPSAITVALDTVAPLGLTVTKVHLVPDIIRCADYWGTGIAFNCLGPAVLNGTAMHGWVAFAETDKVAVIQLTRYPPSATSPATAWRGSITVFAVPPAGWSMP